MFAAPPITPDLWTQLFSDVSRIALWINSEYILTRLYSALHWFHKRLEVNVKNPWENRCFQTVIVFSVGSVDNSYTCTVLWKIAARLIIVCTSVNNEMWVKLSHYSSCLGVKDGLQRTVRLNRCRRRSLIIRTDCRVARSVRHTDACHSQDAQGTDREHPQAGSCQTAKDDGGKPGVRFLARSKRGTGFRTASPLAGTRQRRRRFCSPLVGRDQGRRHCRWARLTIETCSLFTIGIS